MHVHVSYADQIHTHERLRSGARTSSHHFSSHSSSSSSSVVPHHVTKHGHPPLSQPLVYIFRPPHSAYMSYTPYCGFRRVAHPPVLPSAPLLTWTESSSSFSSSLLLAASFLPSLSLSQNPATQCTPLVGRDRQGGWVSVVTMQLQLGDALYHIGVHACRVSATR